MRLLSDYTVVLGTPLVEESLLCPAPNVPMPLNGKWFGMAPMLHLPTPVTHPAVIWLGMEGNTWMAAVTLPEHVP